MPLTFHRWTRAVLLTALGSAGATPVLPASSVAAQAVRDALAPAAPAISRSVPGVQAPQVDRSTPAVQAPRPAPQPVQSQVSRPAPAPRAAQSQAAQTQAASAAQLRAQAIQQAQAQAQQAQAQQARSTPRTGRSVIARATAYNSMAGQTDNTPFITATGTRTRPGVVALSRDLLRVFPYGSRVMIEDLSGKYNSLLRGRVFYVEDTMAVRKTNSIDLWMSTQSQAIQFGARQVRVTAVR